MSDTVKLKTLSDYIAGLKKRIDRLESGGKPLAGLSPSATASFTLAGGVSANDIAVTLAWTNADVITNPKGDPNFTIYVDTDNDAAHEWPFGSSLTSGQRNMRFDWFRSWRYLLDNPAKNRAILRISNLDGSSHDYYLHVNWIVLKGGSGAG